MKHILTKLLLLSFLGLESYTQNAPIILCAEELVGNSIRINWINDHNCGNDFSSTNIYQSLGTDDQFSQIGTLSDPSATYFDDSSAAFNAGQIFYYVEHNCMGSTAVSDTIDNLEPAPPTLISVSVVEDDVEITWEPGDFPESFGTTVYRSINGGPTAIETISGLSVTQTIDMNALPEQGPVHYDVSTIDGCGDSGSYSGLPHSTMHLVVEWIPGDESLDLLWSNYQGWNQIVEYRVLKDGVNIGTSIPTDTTNLLTYVVPPEDDELTCFVIEAESDQGVTSLSNELCVDFGVSAINSNYPSLRVYPNPAERFLFIEDPESSFMDYQIMDLSGTTVESNSLANSKISVAHLQPGLYWIRLIEVNGKAASVKFLKH